MTQGRNQPLSWGERDKFLTPNKSSFGAVLLLSPTQGRGRSSFEGKISKIFLAQLGEGSAFFSYGPTTSSCVCPCKLG